MHSAYKPVIMVFNVRAAAWGRGVCPMIYPVMEGSLLRIESYVGRKVEVVAFGISYVGLLRDVDMEEGTITLSDSKDAVVLELERVDAYFPIDS